jgi:hypothetical protein
MRFDGGFLGIKVFTLGIRSLFFFIVFALSETAFGANHLMTFLSWVTVAGIAFGFGASDSVAVSSESQAKCVWRLVRPATLVGIGSTLLVLLESYWINVAIACVNYGLVFWNLGLVRRRDPVLFEKIANFQMLVIWGIYLAVFTLETPDLRILSLLYALMNGVVALIVFRAEFNTVSSGPRTQERSLYQVSISKLLWEINYSGLTRMPFLLPGISGTVHSAFSYGYLLFEMASAMLSHFQTVFLKSSVSSKSAWIRISAFFLAVNTASVTALLLVFHFQHIIIDLLTDLIGIHLKLSANPLMRDEITSLVIFMLAVTALQCAAFGRYALKLEANTSIVFVTSAVTVIVFAISWAFSIGLTFRLFIPFGSMLLAGLLLVWIIFRTSFDECQFIPK